MKKKNLPGMDLSRIIRLPGLGNILNKRKILVGNGGFLAKLPEAIRLGKTFKITSTNHTVNSVIEFKGYLIRFADMHAGFSL